MHSDAASITGKTHRICQDYARAGITSAPYVLVADGCSSSTDSDFGARILVKSAENLIRANFGDGWHDKAIHNAQKAVGSLSLNETCLDTTLLSLIVDEDLTIRASIFGDGVLAISYKDGSTLITSINYPSGYPQYLSYRLNENRRTQLKSIAGDNARVVRTMVRTIAPEDNLAFTTKMQENEEYKKIFPLRDEIHSIAIMTDGVQSFMRKGEDGMIESVPLVDVVLRIMDVKFYKGEFMQRQMNGFVKEFTKNGWYNVDDFTVGAIYLGSDD